MTWALWLAVPVVATVLASLWTWWRGRRARPKRRVTTAGAMQAHREYLDALVTPARSAHRRVPRPTDDPGLPDEGADTPHGAPAAPTGQDG